MSTSSTPKFGAIVLAAGKGTRMRSALPKVLHEIAGRPMLGHAIAVARQAGAAEILLVTSPDQDNVRAYADELEGPLTHCIQAEQLGTGDARSEEHTSELQSQSTISYAVFCLTKKN